MAECPVNKACDQIYRSRYPTTPPDSRTSYYSTEDDPSHSEEVDYDGVNDHLPNSGYYDSSYDNLTREPDEYDCDNYEPNHSTSEDEEKCEPDSDDADGDEEEDIEGGNHQFYGKDNYNQLDEQDNYDYGDQEEDETDSPTLAKEVRRLERKVSKMGKALKKLGLMEDKSYGQPDERNLHEYSDTYLQYLYDMTEGMKFPGDSDVNEDTTYIDAMTEGEEFHVDAYIKRRNYAMCGDDLDVDKDDENTPIVFICAALYKRAVPCNFFSMKREEVFEHLQNDHFTSNYGLIHTYARVYTC